MTGLELLRVSVLRGPNVWTRFPVLEVWVDLHDLADLASDELPGFNHRLKAMLPTLIEHRCSVGERGGFYQRLTRGTYMAHILEHVVLELQSLVGPEVGYGKTRETNKPGTYKMAIEFEDVELGKAACQLGREVCMAAVLGTPLDLSGELARLRQIWERNQPSRFLVDLLAAAKKARIPARILDGQLVQLGTGARQRRVLKGLTDRTSGVGAGIAADRELTRTILEASGLPLARGVVVRSAEAAVEAAEDCGYPVLLRPRTTAVAASLVPLTDADAVRAAFQQAYHAEDWTPMVEPVPSGEEYQLLVIGNRVEAALNRAGQDVTDSVHPAIAERAVDAAYALKLDVAVVEVATPNLGQPLETVGGVVIGVKTDPDLNRFAELRPVAKAIVSALFPEPRKSRIPVVAVTGTNGKTTTARLTAHLLGQVWAPVGLTCTDGITLGGRLLDTGDCSGPRSARLVLQHPDTRAAVLETARGGILREGLGFDKCEVSIVTNIGEGDHLGLADIETAEDLAGVKETIVWATAPWGAAVLNAADPLVVKMRRLCDGETIFFALSENEPVLAEHRAAGGKAVFVRDNAIVLADGPVDQTLIGLEDVPLTHGGIVGFQVENTIASVAAAWFLGVPHAAIRRGLQTFTSSLDQVPARFNLMSLRGGTVVGDYGHNTSALVRMLEALDKLPAKRRTVVYSAAGDRRNEDMLMQAELLGNFFDRVIVYEDTCRRGRAEGEITAIFREGLRRGRRVCEVVEVPSSMGSVEVAVSEVVAGDLLLLQLDLVDDAIALLRQSIAAAGGREITFLDALLNANLYGDAGESHVGSGEYPAIPPKKLAAAL
ncbi:MAG: hypothetical protein LC104_20560 [Bacteroidales bacterium]|nr:hypothetical protein [Bacteroidales bacterium]